jgi:hypothetical protein
MVHILGRDGYYPSALCGAAMGNSPFGNSFAYLVDHSDTDAEWKPANPSCPNCLLVHLVDNTIALVVSDRGRA